MALAAALPLWIIKCGKKHKKQSDSVYVIAAPCIGTKCGECVSVCPVEAIYAADELPKKWQSYLQKNAQFFEIAQ